MVNKRQYKSNRGYRAGYDDGYDDGFGKGFRKQKANVSILLDRLEEEERINAKLHDDVVNEKAIAEEQKGIAEEQKAIAEKQKAIAEERSVRCDELEYEVAQQKGNVKILLDKLEEEECINAKLQSDVQYEKAIAEEQKAIAEEQKAIAEEQKAIAEERSVRCDELEYEVAQQKGRIDGLKEEAKKVSAEVDKYEAEYKRIRGKIDDLHTNSDELEADNLQIDEDLIFVQDKPFLSDFVRETFSNARRELQNLKRANIQTIESNQRRCNKLGKEAEGINSKLRNAKANHYNVMKELVKTF